MFSNLIESDSHVREFKRRSSFFLITVAAYALILSAAGLIGILTYDATVEAQTSDLTVLDWIPPVKPVTPNNPPPTRPDRPRSASNAPVDPHIIEAVRTRLETSINDPRKIPDTIATSGSQVPSPVGRVRLGDRNADPPSAIPNVSGCVTCTGTTPTAVVEDTPPPQPPVKKTQFVSSTVLLAKVIILPKPPYPILAKQMGVQGTVNVQVLVDETGNVVSAQAVKGHPMLITAAQNAARRARFTPTMLNSVPVKVQGVIVYNFVLQ